MLNKKIRYLPPVNTLCKGQPEAAFCGKVQVFDLLQALHKLPVVHWSVFSLLKNVKNERMPSKASRKTRTLVFMKSLLCIVWV